MFDKFIVTEKMNKYTIIFQDEYLVVSCRDTMEPKYGKGEMIIRIDFLNDDVHHSICYMQNYISTGRKAKISLKEGELIETWAITISCARSHAHFLVGDIMASRAKCLLRQFSDTKIG